VNLIVASYTVDGWLGVDGQKPELVHLCELFRNNGRLKRGLLVGPWQRLEFLRTEASEQATDIRKRLRVSPEFKRVIFLFMVSGSSAQLDIKSVPSV